MGDSILEHDFEPWKNERKEKDNTEFPDRPINFGRSLPFYSLHTELFEPLLENRNSGASTVRFAGRKYGPGNHNSKAPHEIRRQVIEAYISRWRKQVGNDFYPALRLILPDRDRDRSMYGLKEKVLARFIVKILKIDKTSPDARDLLNFKAPNGAARAGDFAARALQVFTNRPFRTEPSTMTIDEVNDELDKLSMRATEDHQLPILDELCRNMCPAELKWLVCIILRNMHVGASEKTFLQIWHPDAEQVFNITSSLKKVCWNLPTVNIRLEQAGANVILFECFQPQLAQYQPRKMTTVPQRLGITEADPVFWIEEKLDGERIQMHLRTTKSSSGNSYREFKFWSRNGKDYTYLYGESVTDPAGALTRHLGNAFEEGVENAILDGEMITWDLQTDSVQKFGTLKTAALEQSRNPYAEGHVPLFRAFDLLYLNDTPLTRYTLRDRRKAMERILKPVRRRMEILGYTEGRTWEDIEAALRRVVVESSEGLVLKNPRSSYTLSQRIDDWMKVKPEYMSEWGDAIECLVVGGYYGTGKRGGGLASFLCALRIDTNKHGPNKTWASFFKVGGGMTRDDYASINHITEGKWHVWYRDRYDEYYIELGGRANYQYEKPDVWITPEDSVVLQVKASSVEGSDEFAAGITLRFPRFEKIRGDRDAQSALTEQGFLELKARTEEKKKAAEQAHGEKVLEALTRKKHQRVDLRNKPLQVAGYSQKSVNQAVGGKPEVRSQVFKGMTIFVLTESLRPRKMSKIELEELVKAHGGHIVQKVGVSSLEKRLDVICIAARRTVKVASIVKQENIPIMKPTWIFDCISQAVIDASLNLPEIVLRPELNRHVFYYPQEKKQFYEAQVDRYSDSFARDTAVQELKICLHKMTKINTIEKVEVPYQFEDLIESSPGCILSGTVLCSQPDRDDMINKQVKRIARFAGAQLTADLNDQDLTHVIVSPDSPNYREVLKGLKENLSHRSKLPRVVKPDWVLQSWKESTRLAEERFEAT